ncbi:hypothetical protein HDU97_000021 [Phlyctochytrium planicorne]|nr:hypothetical protein HDU97_000021 [Phlyctochytrium planicorne]
MKISDDLLRDKTALTAMFSEEMRLFPASTLKQAASCELLPGLKPKWSPMGDTIVVEETLIKSLEKMSEQKKKELEQLTMQNDATKAKRMALRSNNSSVNIPPVDIQDIRSFKTTSKVVDNEVLLNVPGQDGFGQDIWNGGLEAMEHFEAQGYDLLAGSEEQDSRPHLGQDLLKMSESWKNMEENIGNVITGSQCLGKRPSVG